MSVPLGAAADPEFDAKRFAREFAAAASPAERFDLVEGLPSDLEPPALPDDAARYLYALALLGPQLQWHPLSWTAPKPDGHDRIDRIKRLTHDRGEQQRSYNDSAWFEASTGDMEYLAESIPAEIKQAQAEVMARWRKHLGDRVRPGHEAGMTDDAAQFYWTVADRSDPRVKRALRFFGSVRDGDWRSKSRQWVADLGRNNTVITFDIAGAIFRGQDAPLIMDVRAASQVELSLYHITDPAELAWACAKVGKDFIYRDFGMQHGMIEELWMSEMERNQVLLMERDLEELGRPAPDFAARKPVHRWSVKPAKLERLPPSMRQDRDGWWADEGDDELWLHGPDAQYFDDACYEHSRRLDYDYHPKHERFGVPQPSSWNVDRILEIPGKHLDRAGAYILIAEANGEKCHVPLLVDPLSLTLRRCRDGVMAVVSDPSGAQPVPSAKILAASWGEAVADAEGVAFLKVAARGDEAIIAHHDGRFAIGGFGRVFAGIYFPVQPEQAGLVLRGGMRDLMELPAEIEVGEIWDAAHVYRDRFLAAAYTDRPIYRPAQEVGFKLILRQLKPGNAQAPPTAGGFRADDFERELAMALPKVGMKIRYQVLNPRGRAIANGILETNDFGTAAGRFGLEEESVVGTYSLRVFAGGMDRIVPNVFAVSYYRRPGFGVELRGLADAVERGTRKIEATVVARYDFGKPLPSGEVRVRLVRRDMPVPLCKSHGQIDASGEFVFSLESAAALPDGECTLIAEVTDLSGRTVSASQPLYVGERPQPDAASPLGMVPRFHPLGEPLKFPSTAVSVQVAREQVGAKVHEVEAAGGIIHIDFEHEGWHTIRHADEQRPVFVYGSKPPTARGGEGREEGAAETWVDLANFDDYQRLEFDSWGGGRDLRQAPVLALFDEQTTPEGSKLRALVYLHRPHKRARLLFTFEGRTIVDYAILGLGESPHGYQIVEIPIKQRHLPNFYLQAHLLHLELGAGQHAVELREERPDSARELGFEALSLDPRWCRVEVTGEGGVADARSNEKLRVRITTDRERYRPGEKVAVDVEVSDRESGEPRLAEVSLSAIDSSLFAFANGIEPQLADAFSSARPPRRFLRKPWRSSRGDLWGLERWKRLHEAAQFEQQQDLEQAEAALSQQADAIAEAQAGNLALTNLTRLGTPQLNAIVGQLPVQSIPLAKLRRDFRETAAWLPQIRTDDRGRAHAEFTLPDSLTRYRITGVALTKDTHLGTSQDTHFDVSLPLSVQLFTPRFAISGDRLRLTALIHNRGVKALDVDLEWKLSGASISPEQTQFPNWVQPGPGDVSYSRRVPGGSTTELGMWIDVDQRADEVVAVVAVSGKAGADSVERRFPVQPFGRERELHFHGELTDSHAIDLPPGFHPSSLVVTLSRQQDLRESLDGLDYLIQFPYGCVEQTMSRFLPGVMVAAAAKEAQFELPQGVADRLPEVLRRGLSRLYNFQKPDGSWGWWSKDPTDDNITLYVLYGLARCKSIGVEVDPQVLDRGCKFLNKKLKSSKLSDGFRARALLVLALAGKADAGLLQQTAAGFLGRDPAPGGAALCNLALAAKIAGSGDDAAALRAKAKAWKPESTADISLLLLTELEFGARADESRPLAQRLADRRRGSRWKSTRDTSWALESLARFLPLVEEAPANVKTAHATASVNGEQLIDTKSTKGVGKFDAGQKQNRTTFRARVGAAKLRSPGPIPIRLRAGAGDEQGFYFRIVARGFHESGKMDPIGREVKVTRRFAPAATAKIGDVVEVHLTLELTKPQDYLILEARRPAGCEFVDGALDGELAKRRAHAEFRDDRLAIFFRGLGAGQHHLTYYIRAETAGKSQVLPAVAYPMYNERLRGESASAVFEVRAK